MKAVGCISGDQTNDLYLVLGFLHFSNLKRVHSLSAVACLSLNTAEDFLPFFIFLQILLRVNWKKYYCHSHDVLSSNRKECRNSQATITVLGANSFANQTAFISLSQNPLQLFYIIWPLPNRAICPNPDEGWDFFTLKNFSLNKLSQFVGGSGYSKEMFARNGFGNNNNSTGSRILKVHRLQI